jgi:molecular chaperone DnaK
MRIKLKYPDVDTFIHKYSANISRGGIFISTRTPKPVGTRLKFEFLLAAPDGERCVIRGEGQVQWTKEYDPDGGSKAHGMGVKFTRLDAESQAIVERALEYRAPRRSPLARPRRRPARPRRRRGRLRCPRWPTRRRARTPIRAA